jgi:restriction system protein
VWSLTEEGRARAALTHSESLEIFRRRHAKFVASRKATPDAEEDDPAPDPDAAGTASVLDFREAFLTQLQQLPPAGFERFAQRLLLVSGFQEVEVTGKSGDGGIDGIGRLQVNPMVSTKVLFQCKRYIGTVGSKEVRDFRGAMAGRSENGIIVTTGGFSAEARREAIRDGVSPIELVDGPRLIELCQQLQLGLLPVTTFAVDQSFFAEFV